MSNVIQLAAYRRRTRKQFLSKHGGRLDRFIERFVTGHIDVDFRQIAEDYQVDCAQSEVSWDYVHFREVLAEAMDAVFGKTIFAALQQEFWFDAKLITKDEIIERVLSAYVMGHYDQAILIGK